MELERKKERTEASFSIFECEAMEHRILGVPIRDALLGYCKGCYGSCVPGPCLSKTVLLLHKNLAPPALSHTRNLVDAATFN